MTAPSGDSSDSRHSHYFDSAPTTKSAPSVVHVALPDLSFDLTTDTGVFGRRRLDPGTKILLQEAPALPDSGNFLDLGCGVGPIAITMASRRPSAHVWAVDVNQRARHLAKENALRMGLSNLRVVSPEEVPGQVLFDVIWSNPPIKIGKSALHELLLQWLERLSPLGRAVFVVHKNLGSDSLATWLEHKGWTVRRIVSRQGYRLLEVHLAQ